MILNLLAGLILATSGVVYDGHGQTVDYLNVTGSDITVTDLRVRKSGPGTNAVTLYGDRNTLRRLTVELAGATGVYCFSGDGHTIEDSTIRDPARQVGRDSWGIANNACSNLTVRRTTVYGSGYTQWQTTGPGTRLLDNTFTIPEDYRTDCRGNIQRDGPCQCGEFGIAIKGGDGGEARGNRISGYRKADPVCGGSGTPGAGIATAAGNAGTWTRKWTFANNLVTDSTFGLYVGPDTSDITIEANRFCRTGTAIQDGFSVRTRITDNDLFESPLNIYSKAVVSGNRQLRECPP